jgi:hypothetical protein
VDDPAADRRERAEPVIDSSFEARPFRYLDAMRRSTVAALLGAAAVSGTAAYRLRSARRARSRPISFGRWHAVTVFRPLDEVAASLPKQLTEPADAIEIQLSPAPGGRGTEIHARAVDGTVSDADLRRALRESRSLLEVGEVLRPGGPTTEPTVLNRALRVATRHGREEGLL